MQIDFYHLAAAPPERVIASIATRILANRGRLLVIAGEEAAAAALDAALWTFAPDSFVPHGRAGQPGEATQPILIAPDFSDANGARHVLLADGIWREVAPGFERAFYLFDDRTIGGARAAWKALAGREGVERNFWKQDASGRWAKAA